MRLTVRGKGIEVTPALKGFTTRKLQKLGKYFEPGVPAQVRLSVERDRHICEVTVPVDGRLLRGEESSPDMYASVDRVVDKLERQIHKYKTLINRKKRRDGAERHPEPPAAGPDDVGFGEWAPAVVRAKRFPLKPMTVEEAILQMDLLGHDFFVFANAESEQVNVVYRRRAGDYGLIEPER